MVAHPGPVRERIAPGHLVVMGREMLVGRHRRHCGGSRLTPCGRSRRSTTPTPPRGRWRAGSTVRRSSPREACRSGSAGLRTSWRSSSSARARSSFEARPIASRRWAARSGPQASSRCRRATTPRRRRWRASKRGSTSSSSCREPRARRRSQRPAATERPSISTLPMARRRSPGCTSSLSAPGAPCCTRSMMRS